MSTDRPPGRRFHFGPWVFSIDAADALIAATPRRTRDLDVAAWATAYGLTHIDDPHRRTVNLIGPARVLIDGTHRLYRAWRERLPRLPAYLLTPAETRQIQNNALLGPGRAFTTPPTD